MVDFCWLTYQKLIGNKNNNPNIGYLSVGPSCEAYYI